MLFRKPSREVKAQEKWMHPSTVPRPQNPNQQLPAILLPPPSRTRRRRKRERDEAKQHYISKPYCKLYQLKILLIIYHTAPS
jgi:hypothetical protein